MRFWLCLVLISCLVSTNLAAVIDFDNCLPDSITESNPLLLQFSPLHFDVTFNTTDTAHHLDITIYGNVSGRATEEPYPLPDDPSWSDPNDTLGKIPDINNLNNKYTTLFAELHVLTYTPYTAPASRFCANVVNAECPIPPAFYVDPNNISGLPGFHFSHDMGTSYAFATITPTFHVKSGDTAGSLLACVSASITPDLGHTLRHLLRYIPVVILIAVALATVIAATYSPWGTTDIFRWSSNYGRDEDLLRLVTPGFADCLGYIQFIFLTGSLSLNYPGYYQPVVRQAAWSSLMFNQSLVSHGHGSRSITDGIYTVNGTYGFDRISQLVGMTSSKDIWASMMVSLLIIMVAVVALVQIGFLLRWVLRTVGNVQEEDLRAKNMPFTVGNVIRIVFNYFLLPIVSLSMFQLVIASQGPTYNVALAAIVLIILIVFIFWIMLLFARTPRRAYLFDDLPTVLLYGPLYNTYSDDAATFALIPLFVNFLRGIAIGAVQPSGTAQIVLLAVSEIILALTLNAFRPFPSPTSMNIYQTFFAVIRLVTIVLSIAFVPSLGLTEAPKGWIGYAILLMHGGVLIFGFLLNALSTIFEVVARLAGAGGEASGGAARGGLTKVLGVRQLSRRLPRRDTVTRHSMASEAAILGPENDRKSMHMDAGRVRSMSASSAQLLRSERASTAFDSASAGLVHSRGSGSGQFTPTTPVGGNTFAGGPSSKNRGSMSPGGIAGIKQAEAADRYYRAPRPRRNTMDPLSPADRSRASWASGDWTKTPVGPDDPETLSEDDIGEGPSNLDGQKLQADDFIDDAANDLARTRSDYAVREVDFYYGVRGPALSSGTRKLKTGPADPTGPVSSATGWFKGLLGGKSKDKHKGFEVVRSSRAPPPGLMPRVDGPSASSEPYKDEPEAFESTQNDLQDELNSPTESDRDHDGQSSDEESGEDEVRPISHVSAVPPSLPAIDTGGDIELPSRAGSKASRMSRFSRPGSNKKPPVPRKSSRRGSSGDFTKAGFPAAHLSTVQASPPSSPRHLPRLYNPDNPAQRRITPSSSQRLPFAPLSNPSPAKTQTSVGESTADSSLLQLAEEENRGPLTGHHARTSSSALGPLAPDLRGDRPSSMGYVTQHRAGEHIHQASPDSPEFQESSAEIVDR